jgi:hypothetical protein
MAAWSAKVSTRAICLSVTGLTKPVFNAMLENAVRLCRGRISSEFTRDFEFALSMLALGDDIRVSMSRMNMEACDATTLFFPHFVGDDASQGKKKAAKVAAIK